MTELAVKIECLSKLFPGARGLNDVSIKLRRREVVGLVGENGAGKSTLLKVLAGFYRADGGRIIVRGTPVSLGSVAQAASLGIGIMCQEQSLLPNVSVAENILLGHEDQAVRAGLYDWKRLYSLAATQLAKLGAKVSPSAQTSALSFAERQLVSMAKVLAIEERTKFEPIILLDEPTSMLSATDIETVLEQIERLRGCASVVLVSHRLEEMLRVCDRIYVMADGRCVAERDRSACDIADLKHLIVSRGLGVGYDQQSHPPPVRGSQVRLNVQGLGLGNSYKAVSFELDTGEVLGIAELAGAGGESLCRTLFGAERPDLGEVVLDGQSVRFRDPSDAVRLGIGYVPAERSLEGIVAGFSVRENMTLAHLDDFRHGPFIDFAREQKLVANWIERLNIKTPTPETPVQQLSGGNQQKIVLAKWLIGQKLKVLILDHPLRGLDVGTKDQMLVLIRALAKNGLSILVIADNVEELLALSDSIIVMKDGVVTGRFRASEARPSELNILERMV